VRFCHNYFEKPQIGQFTQLHVTKIEGKGVLGRKATRTWRFLKVVAKIMPFRHISAKI